MAWASIAAKNVNKSPPILLIKYNVSNLDESKESIKDNIPRHREITPHPADDFIMTNNNMYQNQEYMVEYNNEHNIKPTNKDP